MVQYFHHMQTSPLIILSSLSDQKASLKSIEAAHSSYQQLTIDNNRAAATLNTIQLAKQLKEASLMGGDNCVIKVVFTNVVYPIQIDALNQVFSKVGNVLKIVLTQKSTQQTLLSFSILCKTLETTLFPFNKKRWYRSSYSNERRDASAASDKCKSSLK